MGWSGGSELFPKIWNAVEPLLDSSKKVHVCKIIISAMEDHDWDTQDEVKHMPYVKQALVELHPDWDWDWYEE